MYTISDWRMSDGRFEYRFSLLGLGEVRFLEIEQREVNSSYRGNPTASALVELGVTKARAEWHEQKPTVEGEPGLWLPAVKPGDSIILDTPGAPAVKAIAAGDHVYKEIEKKGVKLIGKNCTCPIFELIAGGCTCGGFKSEKEQAAGAGK